MLEWLKKLFKKKKNNVAAERDKEKTPKSTKSKSYQKSKETERKALVKTRNKQVKAEVKKAIPKPTTYQNKVLDKTAKTAKTTAERWKSQTDPIKTPKQYIESGQSAKYKKRRETFAKDHPFLYGVGESFGNEQDDVTFKRKFGIPLDTKKAKDSFAYKAGTLAGLVGESAVTSVLTGGGSIGVKALAKASGKNYIKSGSKDLAKNLVKKDLKKKGASAVEEIALKSVKTKALKGPSTVKKLSKGQRIAVEGVKDATVGIGQNIRYAQKENPDDKLKNVAMNTAIDVATGGLLSIPSIAKANKLDKNASRALANVKAKKSVKNDKTTVLNASFYKKNTKNGAKTSKNDISSAVSPEKTSFKSGQKFEGGKYRVEDGKAIQTVERPLTKAEKTANIKKADSQARSAFKSSSVLNRADVKKAIKTFDTDGDEIRLTDSIRSAMKDTTIAREEMNDAVYEVRNYLKNGIKLDPKDIANFDEIKKEDRNFAKYITDLHNEKGQQLDIIYDELHNTFGNMFPETATSADDKLKVLRNYGEQFRKGNRIKGSDIEETELEEVFVKPIVEELSKARKTNTVKIDKKSSINSVLEKEAKANGTYPGKTPKAIGDDPVQKGVDTVLRGDLPSDDARQVLKERIVGGEFTKAPTLTDKEALEGAEASVEHFEKGIKEGTYNKDDVIRLFKDVKIEDKESVALQVEILKKFGKDIDPNTQADMLEKTVDYLSEMGRGLQSAKLLLSATPEGRLTLVEKRIAKKLSDKFADRLDGKTLTLSEKSKKAILSAKTENDIQKANDMAMADLWDQIPANFMEKLDNFRYIAMLGNPKTHIRNVLGNAFFIPLRKTKNLVALPMEKMAVKSGKADYMTSAVLNRKKDKELLDFGKKIFDENVDVLRGNSSKYAERMRPQESKVYDTQWLEKFRKFNGDALDKEDIRFMGPTFRDTMARYMKANNIKPSELKGKELDKAIDIAKDEALRATYRDFSRFANRFTKTKHNLSNSSSTGGKVAGAALEGIMPFVKTPTNILRRGVDYSPIGLINGVSKIVKASRKGDKELVLEGIDRMASGLTGSGVVALGMLLHKTGIIEGSMGNDALSKYKKELGYQPNSLKIGDMSFTVDWVTPVSMPLFVGAELSQMLKEEGLDYKIGVVADSLTNIMTPLTELSMLQGISNMISGANRDNAIPNMAGTALVGYASQFVPTLFGQVARTIDGTRRSTLSTSQSEFGKLVEQNLLKNANKIPWLSKASEPYVDSMGKVQAETNIAMRIFENFFSPSYISKKEFDDVDMEILRLANKLDPEVAKDVIPKGTSDYTMKFNGEDVRLTKEAVTTLQTSKGQYSHDGIEQLMKSPRYAKMTDTEKSEAIASVYKEARKKAKVDTLIAMGKDEFEVRTSRLSSKQREVANKFIKTDAEKQSLYKAIDKIDNAKTEIGTLTGRIKAFALQGSKDKVYKVFEVSDENKKAVADYKKAGGSMKELSRMEPAYSRGGDSTLWQAYELAKEKANSRVYSLYEVERKRPVAEGLLKYKVKKSMVVKAELEADYNNSGRIGKDEGYAYLEKTKYTREQKSLIFRAIAAWNSRNPYGDIVDYDRSGSGRRSSGGSGRSGRRKSGGSGGRRRSGTRLSSGVPMSDTQKSWNAFKRQALNNIKKSASYTRHTPQITVSRNAAKLDTLSSAERKALIKMYSKGL